MANALIRKLESYGPLAEDDRLLLDTISSRPKIIEAKQDLIREGDQPDVVQLILDGFAVRYKMTSDGNRQIFAYLVPGDFCDLHVALLERMDHSIGTVSQCHVVHISRQTVLEIIEQRPGLAKAFWWCSLVDSATLREWLLNIGQRSAEHRIAHLFCELHVRLKVIGLTSGGSFHLPFTQTELGDTMGLSVVHVNRSLKALRQAKLVTFHSGRIFIPDIEHLKEYSGFEPSYLHLRAGTIESGGDKPPGNGRLALV